MVDAKLAHPGMPVTSATGISCLSRSFCFAVGTGAVLHGRTKLPSSTGLIWRFDGHSWRLAERLPIAESSLAAISCHSRSACWIVGAVGERTRSGSHPVALRLRGGSWQPARISGAGSLDAIDCVSATACFAVGANMSGGSPGHPVPSSSPLVEEWNGLSWRAASVQGAMPGPPDDLSAVSCASKSFCAAVGLEGSSFSLGNQQPIAAITPRPNAQG